MCEQYKEMIRARYDVLNKSRDLHDRLDKVSYGHLWHSLKKQLKESFTVCGESLRLGIK